MTMARISLLTSVLLIPHYVSSFVVPSSSFGARLVKGSEIDISYDEGYSSTSLFAQKKKRRRRKNTPSSSSPSSAPPSAPMPITDGDELPDFDLVEDIDLEEQAQAAASASAISSSGPSVGVAPAAGVAKLDTSDPTVMAAMRSTNLPAGGGQSTKDLLRSRNRELENKLVVNEITEAVPSLGEYMSSPDRKSSGGDVMGVGGGMGKKAARREARRAAAMEAEQAGVEEESIFDKLPFFKKKENQEEKSPIKLLEDGTWACIFILVAWEVYINSPFFERAAPLAPVVFTDPVTMTFLP